MEPVETLYHGFVDAGKDGLLPVEIMKQPDGYISAWISDEMADDAGDDVELFIKYYGEWLYPDPENYRTGEVKVHVKSVWV